MKRLFSALTIGIALAWTASAQEPYEPRPLAELLIAGVSYDEDIPTPADVTGYEVGEIIWPHELVIQYVRTVDAVSDRMMVEQVSESHLGEPAHASLRRGLAETVWNWTASSITALMKG